MKKKLIVGIDVSKSKLDVTYLFEGSKHHFIVKNNESGYKNLVKTLSKVCINKDEWLIGFENTGVYSINLPYFFKQEKIDFCHEAALRIKKSMGIKREKNDKVDSKDIASYISTFKGELRTNIVFSKNVQKLKALFSYRKRLLKQKHALKVSSQELFEFFKNDTTKFVVDSSNELIENINEKIKEVEKEMKKCIDNTPELKKNYDLATSVISVSLIVGSYMLILTNNFTMYNSRGFACHSGVAPHEHSSGTSFQQDKRTSKLANKHIKSLLTNSANNAIKNDPQLKNYYLRKIKEGKNEYSVLNAIRFKIISRVFATVKRGTPYVKLEY